MYFKDPNFKRKETTLGMVDSLGPKLQDLRFILKKLMKVIFHTRKKRTVIDCS